MAGRLLGVSAFFAAAFGAPAGQLDIDIDNDMTFTHAIELKGGAADLSVHADALKSLSKASRRKMVRDVLVEHATSSQAQVVSTLREFDIPFSARWINNVVYANLPAGMVETLRVRDDVFNVRETYSVPLMEPIDVAEGEILGTDELQWQITLMGVDKAWDITTGEGVVVANIDTGARFTHESLVGNYRGNNGDGTFSHDYNWFALTNDVQPKDNNGHGTHTMGSIAGQTNGVGVAPGATWIAAKGCRFLSCPEADLTGSAEFVLCPTKVDGSDPDCSLGADIVSNSWGGGTGDMWYTSYTQAWQAAGMIPVFAQGNSGPICKTANSPGDYPDVIGVGSTTQSDGLSFFSSRGPAKTAVDVKPDISAPGSAITSAGHRSDDGYASQSGTSMACPQIAGVAALMLSANPNLSYSDLKHLMESTTFKDLESTRTCGGTPYDVFPNNMYGHGRVDAYAAVVAAQEA